MPDIVNVLLTSPVLVALIPSVVSIIAGRLIVEIKDEQLKTKDVAIETLKRAHAAELKIRDAEISALERMQPAAIQEQVTAIKQFFELRIEQLTDERDAAKTALDERRGIESTERNRLSSRLRELQNALAAAERASRTAEEAGEQLVALANGIGQWPAGVHVHE